MPIFWLWSGHLRELWHEVCYAPARSSYLIIYIFNKYSYKTVMGAEIKQLKPY